MSRSHQMSHSRFLAWFFRLCNIAQSMHICNKVENKKSYNLHRFLRSRRMINPLSRWHKTAVRMSLLGWWRVLKYLWAEPAEWIARQKSGGSRQKRLQVWVSGLLVLPLSIWRRLFRLLRKRTCMAIVQLLCHRRFIDCPLVNVWSFLHG